MKFRYLTVALSTLGLAAAFAASSRAESSSEQNNVPHWVASAQKVASAVESQRVSLTTTTEYCEGDIGGTSLSSPLFAGVLALVNQARFDAHKGAVGLVNPALYNLHRGPWQSAAPVTIVNKPTVPTAVLRGYANNLNQLRVVTINSTLNPNHTTGAGEPALIQGADSSLRVTSGYSNVTGLGTPNVPAMIEAFATF